MEDEDGKEEEYYDTRLYPIDETLGEKGMPKFTPPVPRNHNELFVQNLVSRTDKTLKPTKNSTVELQFCGWVSEEGDLWRPTSDLSSYQQLRTVLLVSGKDSTYPSSAVGESRKCSEIVKPRFSKNRTDLDRESVYGAGVTELGKAFSTFETSASVTPRASTGQLKPIFLNQDSYSTSYTAKSSIYGKCVDYTESWEVTLGAGEIVEGLELVILNMSVGDEVIAFIPSRLAHGEEGLGRVFPPRADLIVQVHLQKII